MPINKYLLPMLFIVVFLPTCSPDPVNRCFQAIAHAGENADSKNFIRPSTMMLDGV